MNKKDNILNYMNEHEPDKIADAYLGRREFDEELETEANYNFFFKYARISQILLYILAAIVFIVGVANCAEDETGVSFMIYLVYITAIIITAIISKPFIEWKGYMLKNIYEINKKTKKSCSKQD